MNYNIETKEGMAHAVQWTESLFAFMREGGVWGIPRSETLVRVYPSKKEVVITGGVMPEESLTRVIEAMGWTIVKK